MEHALSESLGYLANGKVLLLMVVGIAIGLATGILPGFNVLVVLIILLPYTYHMTPIEAFALLLAVYSVYTMTGDITTILLGIPAQPDCAAMVLDGYPMTKKGEAARALGAAITSVPIGALVGALLLFLALPILRPLVIHLGAPDLFALIVLGLTMVGTLSGGGSILKGLGGAAIGILLATVGQNDQTGIVRYGFGSLYLTDGIALVPLALGLFAVPAIMNMHARGRMSVAEQLPPIGSGRAQGVRDTLSNPGLLIRGSLIGAFTAMLPGLGGAIGQWAAYGQAAQISKTPELFGTGCVEGVIAPGASNNSKEGGALIPTVAFGIPGSAGMAILLAAFTLLGLQPGPDMLTVHLNLTYFMIWVLVLTNLVGAAICFLLVKPLARIAFIPASILMPIITCLIIVGSVSATISWPNVATLLITGIVAWVMQLTGWSVVPVILGFVLGKSGENLLLQSYLIYGTSWLRWPVVDVILALALLMVGSTARRRAKNRAKNKDRQQAPPIRGAQATFRNGSILSIAVAAVVALMGIAATADAYTWTINAALFPMVAGSAITVLAILETYSEVRIYRKMRGEAHAVTVPPQASQPVSVEAHAVRGVEVPPPTTVAVGGPPTRTGPLQDNEEEVAGKRFLGNGEGISASTENLLPKEVASLSVPVISQRKAFMGFVWMLAATLLCYAIGFFLALPIFVFAYLLVLRKPLWQAAVFGVMTAGVFWFLFIHLLNVQLPFSLLGTTWL